MQRGLCCGIFAIRQKAEKTTAESATAFLLLLYQIAMYAFFVLFSLCGRMEVFLPPHPLSSNLLRRVRLFSVECYPMHSFLPFSFLLLSVFNLTLRLSVAASFIYWSFYLYLSALSLSSCLETFVGGLLLSLQPVLLLCYPQSYLC